MTLSALWGWLPNRDQRYQATSFSEMAARELALVALVKQLANKLEDALLLPVGMSIDADPAPNFATGAWELIKRAREDIKT